MLVAMPAASGELAFSVVAPDGFEFVLDESTGLIVQWGISDFRAIGVGVTVSALPLRGGSVIRNVRRSDRHAIIPILVKSATEAGLWDKLDQLAYWTDATRGDSEFRVTRPDGSTRMITGRFTGGLDGLTEALSDSRGFSYAVVPFSFLAAYPYWQDTDDIEVTFSGSGVLRRFLDAPVLPPKLSSGTVIASVTVINDGTSDAWPVWVIHGPGTDPTIRNQNTGEYFRVETDLSEGQSITIDTRGELATVTSSSGGSGLIGVTTGKLFPLVVGNNAIQVEITNNTANTEVELSYRRNFLSS